MARIPRTQDLVEVAFKATMYWRVAYGFMRICLGYVLLGLVGLPVSEAYQHLMRHELTEDPRDRLFMFIGHLISDHGYSITYFMAAYLFFWGFVDIVLSLAMVRHILWTFRVSIVLIVLFMLYELFRYTHTHSPILLGLIVIDVFVAYMIGIEYRKLERKIALQHH